MDDLKSSFLSTVSHELRTPLTSILGFTHMIQKKLEQRVAPVVPTDDSKAMKALAQIRGNLKIMNSEGRRLTDLINNVLDLHRMESDLIVWSEEEIDMQTVLGHAGAACSILFMDKPGVAFSQDISPDLPPVIGDTQRLIQVVINLLSNAAKFTENGAVALEAARYVEPDGIAGVQICVSDTGPGIAETDIDAVFDHFRQVGDVHQKTVGSGLGLSISRKIVQSHGGRIWVESELGVGSRFYFRIPAQPLPASARA